MSEKMGHRCLLGGKFQFGDSHRYYSVPVSQTKAYLWVSRGKRRMWSSSSGSSSATGLREIKQGKGAPEQRTLIFVNMSIPLSVKHQNYISNLRKKRRKVKIKFRLSCHVTVSRDNFYKEENDWLGKFFKKTALDREVEESPGEFGGREGQELKMKKKNLFRFIRKATCWREIVGYADSHGQTDVAGDSDRRKTFYFPLCDFWL